MTTVTDRLGDPLGLLGTATGAFLVLAALGTIAGTPWTTSGSIGAALIQVLGAVLMAAIGIALVYVVRSGDD